MIFSYNWLQSYFKKPLPRPEKLAELLTMHSFEVDEVKRQGKDYVLDIDVLPNRGPDCFSHIGIAREIAAITNSKLQVISCKLQEDKKLKAKDFISVEIKDKNDCSRYTARVVANVRVAPSSKWIQEKLKTCGLRPINNIVDITNYVMLETGQPLHAFDFDKLSGDKKKKIIVRRAKGGDKIVTLDNEKYDLDKDILVIADKESPLAIAGIKGGKKAEIDKKTKTIVLESANFDQRVVRKGSKKLNLKTDASWRFEHRIDPNLTKIAINRTAELIQKETHSQSGYPKIALGLVDFYPKKVLSKKVKLDLNYVEKLLGVKIPTKEVKDILNKLEFKARQARSKQLIVEVPTFRLDISLPEDLIEEISRIYGGRNIPATFPIASLIPPKRNFEIFWEDAAKNILKELGFTEVYNYSFVGEREVNFFNYKNEEMIEVKNPMSLDQKYLRPSLIPNLLKDVKDNFKYFNEFKIFELGKIFINEQRTANPPQRGEARSTKLSGNEQLEKIMLAGVIARKHGDNKGFYQLKGVIDSLLNKLGISDIWYDSYEQTPEESKLAIWHSKKSAEIKIGREEVGFLGEISSEVLKNLKIEGKIILFDINFGKLRKLCSEEQEYQPISQYPSAVRDLAVLVPINVKVVEVLNKISVAGGSLIRDVDLFDIYEGEELPQGKKNLAFHIIYQAENKTLKAKEIDKIQNKIIKVLEKNPKWEVRR